MAGRGRTAAGLDGAVQRGTAASGLRGAIASGRHGAVAKPQGDVWATSEGRNNLRATTSGRQQLRPPRGGAEQRGTARSRGRYGRRVAAASGVGANSGELPSKRRRNTVWTAKYRLDLTRNTSRSASSTVRQGTTGAESRRQVGTSSSHKVNRSILQFRSNTMSRGRRR